MRHPFAFPLVALLLLLAGCEAARSPTTTPTSVAVDPTPAPTETALDDLAKPASEEFVISEKGIGEAQLGMTLAALKAKRGEDYLFEAVSPFIVGFDAIAVSQKGEILYYILHPMGEPPADSDAIAWLLTENAEFRTSEGVGPGTSIPEAEAVYGDATLSYNPDNESREYIKFANFSAENVKFQSGLGNAGFAGIYGSPDTYETTEFQPDTVIDWILVGQQN